MHKIKKALRTRETKSIRLALRHDTLEDAHAKLRRGLHRGS